MRHELRHDMKKLNEEIQEVKRSLDIAWLEIEDSKSNMAKASEDIVIMKAKISSLKDQHKVEREKNVKSEQYTRHENLRLLNVQETEEEDTEQLFTQILTKMRVEVQNMNFHAIHRVGPLKDQAKYRRHDKPPSPRHIFERFVFRKDRDLVWQSRGKIKDTENYKEAFFVPDLTKEHAQDGYILRQALKKAKETYKLNVEIKYNKLVMSDTGLASQIPDYLKVKDQC